MPYQPPYLGVAYYPEDWPEEELTRDIHRFREQGISCVRIGEFAWHRMEPREGEFDFSFFHRVVDALKAAEIAVILCTPTATPPRWLTKQHPEICMLGENGQRASHGGRRHCCSNNEIYLRYSLRIVEEMARSFASEENVIGWQIDNEIYTFDMGCFCPDCVRKFRSSLQARYCTIDALNHAWNLNLFSQWYDSFEDIPAPANAWHHPSLRTAWYTFQNQSHIQFVHRQAEVLHRYVHCPVGTDVMPFNGMDYRKLFSKLDVVQFNHYHTPDNLIHCAFWMDYLRGMKDRPFWTTETDACWNGSSVLSQSVKPDGYCLANTWMTMALGGELNAYWLWRTHWAGHELLHGAVLDTSGRPMLGAEEIQQAGREIHAAWRFLSSSQLKAEVAVQFTSQNWNLFMQQPILPELSYEKAVIERFYQPLNDLGCHPDVIDGAADLTPYRVILSPLMLTLDEPGLPERLVEWIHAGGTWIAGPLTDQRNAVGARYTHCLYGMLETLMGIHWCYALPDTEGHTAAAWHDGTRFDSDTWFEVCDACGADVLANISQGHRAILGKAVVLSRRVGKGRVVLLGTLPSPQTSRRLLRELLAESGIPLREGSEQVLIVPRYQGKQHVGDAVLAYTRSGGRYTPPCPGTDLCTGQHNDAPMSLRPYEVKIVAFDEQL